MPEPKAVERDESEDLAFLGREFLTWLLWRVEQGELAFGTGDDAFSVRFASRARLGSTGGELDAAVLRGAAPAQSAVVRAGIGSGCTLWEAELSIVRGEKEWRFGLVADTFDLRGVKLPELLTEEDDDRFLERVALIQELDFMIETAFSEFLRERTRQSWRRTILPAMRTWLADGLRVDSR